MIHFLKNTADRLEKQLRQTMSVFKRAYTSVALVCVHAVLSFFHALSLLFLPAHKSFQHMHSIHPQKGYSVSFLQHKKHQQRARLGALGFLTLHLLEVVVLLSVAATPTPAFAATCNIAAPTTINQTYITTNSCTDIHITASTTITFSGSLDLVGTGTFYVDSGVTMTESGAMTFTDVNDSVVFNGTVTTATNDSVGVKVTAQTLTISSTGSINVNGKGCTAAGTSNGYGPNGSNVCTLSTAGYGGGFNGAAGVAGGGYGGAGGIGSSGAGYPAGTTYSSALAPTLSGSSGGSAGAVAGGAGGGLVQLTVAGTLTVSGPISANGSNGGTSGTNQAAGGGSGGAINIASGTLTGTSLSFSVNGGNGGHVTSSDGGGGGGGRIYLSYTGGSPSLSSANFSATGGTASGTAKAGAKGTTYVKNGTSPTAAITIYNGFDYDDTDFVESSFTIDASATNQTCKTGAATPSITAATITINANLNCVIGTITSFNLSASSTFSLANNITWTVNAIGSTVDWNLPAVSYTWTGLNFNGGAQGAFTIDDAVDIALVSSTITANVSWTNSTSISIDSASTVSANAEGCVAAGTSTGYGPNGSNVCTISTAGFGGGFNGAAGTSAAGYGGTGGTGSNGYTSGATYGSPTAPTLFGSSGGSAGSYVGGAGGGKIRLQSTGTITINGTVSANGGNGNTNTGNTSSGGGSGGSVYITTSGTLAMTTGSITANGGNGAVGSTSKGGGGGGGRISVNYISGTPTLNSTVLSASGGTATSAGVPGSKGTVYVKKGTSPSADITIYHGFTYDDTDYLENSWVEDTSATNQYCATGSATPSITAGTVTLAGNLQCNLSTVTSFNVSATSIFSVASSTTFSVNATGATVDWNIPAASTQTWTSLNFTGGPQGAFTIDDAVTISLVSTTITANAKWTGITALTEDSASTVSANAEGCVAAGTSTGYGPNGSNVCTISTAGFGGGFNGAAGTSAAGYGGTGGTGSNGYTSGATYGSPTAPTLFGSSGGSAGSYVGGAGGGYIRIDSTGTLTLNGTISANGGAGATSGTNTSSGGGSGGSVYITTSGTLAMTTGSITANGGNGAVGSTSKGGGGGGGRISVSYMSGTPTLSSSTFSVSGGTATSTGVAGAKGTVYVKKGGSPSADVTIYHGFTYDDTDYLENSWTEDTSATNQYCSTGSATPSITASSVVLAGTTNCSVSTITSFNVSATSTFTVSSNTTFSVPATGSAVDWNIPAGSTQTWTGLSFTGGPQGSFTIDDAANISLVSSTITANPSWTNLASLSADAATIISANGKGCLAAGSGAGYGPNTSTNACTASTSGYGGGNNTLNGSSGGGYGGTGGLGSSSIAPAGVTYGSPTAPTLFGSSGGSATSSYLGGAGGGKIRLDSTGTITLNGTVSADGVAGSTNTSTASSGGGSGGSIYVSTSGTLAVATGTFSAAGGNGAVGSSSKGGGGGGGRIALTYIAGTPTLSSSTFTVSGGTATSTGVPGGKGTVYVKKGTSPAAAVTIYHGFSYDDTDYAETSWTEDASATNQYCATGAATPSITAGTIVLAGNTNCSVNTTTSFNLSATSSFSISNGTTWTVTNAPGATVDWNLPAGSSQTWNTLTFNTPSQGAFTIDDAVAISLVSSNIGGNVSWTNLTSLSVDAASSITAANKGCLAAGSGAGYGPNTSTNVCTLTTSGYGGGNNTLNGSSGGGYGGAGGLGSSSIAPAGATYGSSTAPVLFGSSGGSATSSYLGGTGGGKIRLVVSGTLTLNGSISAAGAAGAGNGSTAATGGGSGGSIYMTVGTVAGTTGALTVAGGNGNVATAKGGGGGGGRIAILYGTDSSTWRAGLTAASVAPGGTATSTGVAGSVGTLYMATLSVPSAPTITTPAASATGQSQNLTVTSSVYSSDGLPQTTTDWQISDDNTFSNSDCSDTNIVWCSMASSNLASIAVTSGNGTFAHALSSATKLATGTTYYVRVRYNNGAGSSAWSSSVSFTTTGAAPTSVAVGTGAYDSWAWMGLPVDKISSTTGSSTTSTLGWIHLNCASYGPCNSSTYNTYPKVSIDVGTGNVSGWAWVGNTQADSGTAYSVGWLNFDPAPLTDATYADPSCTAPNYYPAPPCYPAQIDTSNQQEISGWARFDTLGKYGDTMLGTSNENNDWGWVLLRGRNTADNKEFGLVYNGTSLDGWVWSGGGTLPSGAGFSNAVGFGWINFSSAGTGSAGGPTSAYVSTQRGDVYGRLGISNPSGTLSPSQYNATYLILTSDASSIVNFNSQLLGEGNFTSTNWSHLDLPDATNGYKGTLGKLDLTKLTTVTSGGKNVYGNPVTSMSGFSSFTGNQFLNGGVDVVGASCCSGSYTIDNPITFTNGTALPSTGSSYDGSGVIVVNGDLTINDNLYYNNTALLDIKNLASVTWIVRGNLTIGANVKQLVGSFLVIGDTAIGDGLHDGTFTTVATNAQQLSVYGLVMARSFSLNRTYQGTATTDEPAELFYYDGRLLANTPPGIRDYTSLMPIVTQR